VTVLNQTKETGSKDADGKESRAPQSSGEQEKSAFTIPTISLPKGGGAIRGMGGKVCRQGREPPNEWLAIKDQ